MLSTRILKGEKMPIDEMSQIIAMNSDRRLNRLHQEQSLFSTRLNMFFVAESMLILAYISALNIESAAYLNWVFGVIGLVVTIIFLFVFYDQAKYIVGFIEKIEEFDTDYKNPSKQTNIILGLFLPLIFCVVWFIFLFYYFTL